MIRELRKSYKSRYGVPVISRVESGIFISRYFTYCMECAFCHNWCCSWGVDVDAENVKRIHAHADAIEAFTGTPRSQWFEGYYADVELPGGSCARTQVVNGACVFLDRSGKGCLLHRFANENGMDYHELKPMVSSLFPLTFANGDLLPADEVEDNSLVCLGNGPTLYCGIRSELMYYFGAEFIAEMDELEALVRTEAGLDPVTDRGCGEKYL